MWLYKVNHRLGPILGVYWRLGLAGRTEEIPSRGPLLLVINHASFLDPWFVGMAFPRPVRYLITRQWYEKSPAWNAVFRAFGTEPVRAESVDATVESVCAVLARGEVVGLFPEGAVSRDGRIQRFRSGAARIAAKSGAPVLPLGIRGNYRSLPRYRLFPKPTRVTIHVGRVISFPGAPLPGVPPRAEVRAFQTRLLREICELAGQTARAAELTRATGGVADDDIAS